MGLSDLQPISAQTEELFAACFEQIFCFLHSDVPNFCIGKKTPTIVLSLKFYSSWTSQAQEKGLDCEMDLITPRFLPALRPQRGDQQWKD